MNKGRGPIGPIRSERVANIHFTFEFGVAFVTLSSHVGEKSTSGSLRNLHGGKECLGIHPVEKALTTEACEGEDEPQEGS